MRGVRGNRRGFSLVELVVVLAVVCLLVALLMPGLQAVRETARRAQCANNLAQIGKASDQYVAAMRALPPGGHTIHRITWFIAILPQLGELTVGARYHPDWHYFRGPNASLWNVPLANVTCPSDPGPLMIGTWFRGNYVCSVGNLGVGGPDAWSSSVLASRANGMTTVRNGGQPFIVSGAQPINNTQSAPAPNAKPAQVDPASVQDGLSCTIGFSELLRGTSGIVQSGIRGDDTRGMPFHSSMCWFSTWMTPNSPSPDRIAASTNCCLSTRQAPCSSATVTGLPKDQAARSMHPGGVVACRLDGSITFVSDAVDWAVWQAAGTTRGGESVIPE
jgi:prepilin-type N-terminal cleavage/methylation domain-containing protein